ncbi:MAG: hypothetical protein BJ554DRAFT_5221, partial [Olpidium bornovanus]
MSMCFDLFEALLSAASSATPVPSIMSGVGLLVIKETPRIMDLSQTVSCAAAEPATNSASQ